MNPEIKPRCASCDEPGSPCCGQIHPEFCRFDEATRRAKSAYWQGRFVEPSSPPPPPSSCCPNRTIPPPSFRPGQRVRVHWRKGDRAWNVEDAASLSHLGLAGSLTLEDVEFVVDAALRLLSDGGRIPNVHAWAVGTVAEPSAEPTGARLRFRPDGEHAFEADGEAITRAARMECRPDGTASITP